MVAIVKFENGKVANEHLYWDHASVLAQVGVIDPAKVPVKAAESARTLLQWSGSAKRLKGVSFKYQLKPWT